MTGFEPRRRRAAEVFNVGAALAAKHAMNANRLRRMNLNVVPVTFNWFAHFALFAAKTAPAKLFHRRLCSFYRNTGIDISAHLIENRFQR